MKEGAGAAKKGPLLLKIGNKWVNCDVWKKSHPGGAKALERLAGADCTEMFESLHSKEAFAQLARMKDVGPPAGWSAKTDPSTPNKTTLSFRAFRKELEEAGYFERKWDRDAFFIAIMASLVVAGTALAHTNPWIATLLIALGMQQAGWIGHDYVHGRGKASYVLGRACGGLVNAFSSQWWSNKHNKHHVHTNQVGIDDDIANDPVLHLFVPPPDRDFWFRKYQHLYYHIVYTGLYVSWRLQSFQTAWEAKDKVELALMAINYAWLAYLGPSVALGSIFLGGWFVAEVVTATHQSEEMIDGISYQFAEDQFRTTRNVTMDSKLGNWFWGGMQWQLEHHLFPTMPKYNYPEVSVKTRAWAAKNGVPYRDAGALEIFKTNYETMRQFAQLDFASFQKARGVYRKDD